MDPGRPAVFLIGGPPRSGKSTVARLLVARFARSVVLEADGLSAAAGQPVSIGSLPPSVVRAAAAVDDAFAGGATVVLEIAAPAELLGDCRTTIRSRPCHVVVLLPAHGAIAARSGYDLMSERAYDAFAEAPRVGSWLDTSEQTPEQTVDAILDSAHASPAPVVISDYDSAWPALFAELAEPIRGAVAGLAVAIEHVGSTAVPGLAAKPVIDLDVVVAAATDLPVTIEQLRGLGYVYQGDKGIPGRAAFLSPPGARRHHLYVVVAGSKPYLDHVRFRDHLRADPAAAAEYAALKRNLAERVAGDRAAYTAAKSEFVQRILARAGD